MKAISRLLTFCLLSSVPVVAQVAPAAFGSGQAPTAGTQRLIYAFRYAQTAQIYTQSTNVQASSLSGTLDYANRHQRYPFSVDYGGGYTWTLSGPGYQSGQFQHMFVTQGINFRRSRFSFRDDVSYLPQSPTTGFSGIPGIGEIIGIPNPSPPNNQTILTVNTHTVANMVGGDFDHNVSYATTVGVSGRYDLLRFPDNNGLNTDSVSGEARLARRFSGRTTLEGRGVYTHFSYLDTPISIDTGTGYLGIRHRWTRNLSTDVSAGPQNIMSSIDPIVPSSLGYSIAAGANYVLHFTTFNASYSHGMNGGSGYLIGGIADVVTGNYTHQFGPNTLFGLTGGYNRTAALSKSNGLTNSQFGGAQVTWRVANNLIVFANYTAINQSGSLLVPGNTLNQMMNTIGFGFGLSSRELRPAPRQ